MTYCSFGENLKNLRKGRGMTQSELGGKIGLSKAVISKYETGLGYPSFDVLIRIAKFFGVTTDYLLTGRPIALPDQKAVTRLMRTSLESAQTALSTRREQPFTRNELAALFAAMLTDA